MTRVDFDRVRATFLAVRDLDESSRASVLDRECCDDPALREEVESLLAHHDAGRVRVEAPLLPNVVEILLEPPADAPESLPRDFGPFELLEVIGTGGMGTVYRARQRTPERDVAMKVIRPGMMTESMLGRFRYEADVLARLQHPNIARIFEAGSVRSHGVTQPYFALELIDGVAIDRYVAAQSPDIRVRLGLFVKVCDAIQHAHQKGVIHRDLKPGNILVDAEGQPKVLDFGVARATDSDVRTTTLQTNIGQLVGTLPYMSPEQVSGDASRLDVRSDVYSLGVLLFELLTGRLPYDIDETSLAEAVVTIRDASPRRLSAVLTSLRGDLDTIVSKALEKDPERRYQSAAALAQDLQRYLDHQPIVARRASMSYQIRLFARRHRALVAGASLAGITLVIATIVSLVFAFQTQEAAVREGRQRAIAEATNEHLVSILMMPDPHREGEDVTMTEVLDAIVTRLDEEENLPEVEARVRGTIGRTYVQLRRDEDAREQLERAVALERDIEPEGDRLTGLLINLGRARMKSGDRAGAEAIYLEALPRLSGPDAESVRNELLNLFIASERFDEARPIATGLLAAARERGDDLLAVVMMRWLATIDTRLDSLAEAERQLVSACELAEGSIDETHPLRSVLLVDLCLLREKRGDVDGAYEASAQAYEFARRSRTPGSSDWMAALMTYTRQLGAIGRRDVVIETLEEAMEAMRGVLDADDRRIWEVEELMAFLYLRWDQPEKAAAIRQARRSRQP